jgi:hypothetical protein
MSMLPQPTICTIAVSGMSGWLEPFAKNSTAAAGGVIRVMVGSHTNGHPVTGPPAGAQPAIAKTMMNRTRMRFIQRRQHTVPRCNGPLDHGLNAEHLTAGDSDCVYDGVVRWTNPTGTSTTLVSVPSSANTTSRLIISRVA